MATSLSSSALDTEKLTTQSTLLSLWYVAQNTQLAGVEVT